MNQKKRIIACGSLKPELEQLQSLAPHAVLTFLPQNLHRSPATMKEKLQEVLDDKNNHQYREMVLGYGLCSNGIVGLKAPPQGLYIPGAHDCITFYLGSREKYQSTFQERPGTYYLTRAWIEANKDPLGLMQFEYTERVGPEFAEIAIREEIKNYTHICFINTGVGNVDKYRERAMENARYFNKEYLEMTHHNDFLMKIITGPYEAPEFIFTKPNQIVTQKEFIN